MTHYRDDAPRLVGNAGSSAVGWLFALIITAALVIGAWYFLTTSGTQTTPNASLQFGPLDANAVQIPSERTRTA